MIRKEIEEDEENLYKESHQFIGKILFSKSLWDIF
jgi:hypothetical protein